jgi:hypothetical protein
MSTVLSIVQTHFPKVTKVQDAKKALAIEVTANDEYKSKRRNHEECAMAVACRRAYHADGVLIARSIAYLVKGTLAVRFKIPQSVSREITSFDRGGPFKPGWYQLSKPTEGNTLKRKKERGDNESKGGSTGKSRNIRKYHLTTGIRTVLGGKDAEA